MSTASLALLTATLLSVEPALTEERAVEMALRSNPGLSASTHRTEETQALQNAAGRWNNPELRVQNLRSDHLLEPALHGSSFPDHPFEKTSIGLRWSPPPLGQHAARRAEADLETAQANVDLALSRRDVIARVRALHATVLSLDAQIALARGAQEERERTRRLVAHRVDQQAATVVEQSTSEMDYLEAVAATQELEIQRRQAYDDLLQMLGLPPGGTVELSVEGATQCREPGNAPAPRPVAEEDSLRLNAFEAELRTVDTERSRRWLELVPWPSYVQLSYVLRGDNDPAYWTLQFGVTLPLFDWKSADRQALAARRLRLEEEHRAEVAEVDRQMQHALTELAEQRVLVRRYREAALVLEEGLKHFSRSGNTIGLLQAGQLRARMLVARRAHLRAELDCMLSQIKVDRLDCNRRSPRADGGG